MANDILENILAPVKDRLMRTISEVNVLSFEALSGGLVGSELKGRLEEVEGRLVKSASSPPGKGALPSSPSSLLIDVGELHLCMGDKEEAARCAASAREALKSVPVIYASNPAAVLCKLSLLQAKMGSVDALGDAFDLIRKLPNRFPPVNEGYRSVAMTAADCLHLGIRDESITSSLIEGSIERIRTKEERQETLAHVIRKLCMRNETEPADDVALISTAERMMSGLSDPMERAFTTAQVGLAKALKGDIEGARTHFDSCRAMVTSRSSDRIKYACHTNLFRACSQAGLIQEAEELGGRLVKEFEEMASEGREAMEMVEQEKDLLGGRLPRELSDMADELTAMTDAYSRAITSSFMMAGWFPTRASKTSADRYLEQAKGMIERMSTGYSAFKQYLLLSSAYAARGKNDEAIGALREAVDELGSADRKIAKALFFDEIAMVCSRDFLYSNDGRFVELFLEYAKLFGVKGRALSDGCYRFCGTLASLSRDRRWRLIFYINI